MGIVKTCSRGKESVGYTPGSDLTSTRQTLPYVMGPYRSRRATVKDPKKPLALPTARAYSAGWFTSPSKLERSTLYTAQNRLDNRLKPHRAALAITAVQYSAALKMITLRFHQLGRAYRFLRRGNIKQFSRELAWSPDKRTRTRAESVSGQWLEYHFGWAPLLGDIYSASMVLTSDPNQFRQRGSCTMVYNTTVEQSQYREHITQKIRSVCGAGIVVTNPNVALANTLGFLNPVQVAWDAVPFSFVIDWFVKVNQFLSRLNNMAGFAYVEPTQTMHSDVRVLFEYKQANLRQYNSEAKVVVRQRTLGITPVMPTLRNLVMFPNASLWQAVTTSALAVQVFKKK